MERQVTCTFHYQTMALIVRSGTVFTMKIRRIHRWIAEGDLIVIGVVQCFRKGVGAVQLKVLREAMIQSNPESVVVRVNRRLKISHGFRTSRHRIENRRRKWHTDDE